MDRYRAIAAESLLRILPDLLEENKTTAPDFHYPNITMPLPEESGEDEALLKGLYSLFESCGMTLTEQVPQRRRTEIPTSINEFAFSLIMDRTFYEADACDRGISFQEYRALYHPALILQIVVHSSRLKELMEKCESFKQEIYTAHYSPPTPGAP
jgi:hypothetical protein